MSRIVFGLMWVGLAGCQVLFSPSAPGTDGAPNGDATTGQGDGGASAADAIIPCGPFESAGDGVGFATDPCGGVTGLMLDSPGGDGVFLVSVVTDHYKETQSVSGLGLPWTQELDLCGFDKDTGVSLFWAQGSASAGTIQVRLADNTDAAIAVLRFFPGATGLGNSATFRERPDLGCTGTNVDEMLSDYSFTLDPATNASRIEVVVAPRDEMNSFGAPIVGDLDRFVGDDYANVGISIGHVDNSSTNPITLSGSFSATVEFAVAAVEVVL